MNKTIRNILVPINFSNSSEGAISTGIAMCKRHQAVLHLLHVKKESMFVYPPGKNARIASLALEAEVARLDQLELQAQRIQRENNISCFYHLGNGHFHNAVAEIAEDFYCDLIIVEKSRHSGFFYFFNSNNAYKILKQAKCPVLTIPTEKKYLNFKKILFPLRPSTSGLDKFEIALPIIKRNKSKVLLFAPIQDNNTAILKTANDLINKADHLMKKGNVFHENEINITQDMALEVVKKAIEKKSDLIIISASIKKGLISLFTQNYTEKVINNASVPVLSVK